jgi:tetratricopeptide (TPR) repeat protein
MLGGLMEANRNAALNLTAVEESGDIAIRLNTTKFYRNTTIVLVYNGEEIFSESADISPAKPYTTDISIAAPLVRENLKLVFYDSSGGVILEHQPKPKPGNPMPEALQPPPRPEDVKTVEELYLHGLRLDQFYNASVSSYPYYMEALRRDPGDYRVNTHLGVLYTKRKMFEEAEKHLETAVDRITMRYTRPKDSDALYYLGVAKRRLGKNKEAYDLFYDASWNAGWHSASFHQLAELDCMNGDYHKALDHIDRAISTNANNVKALGLKISILRKLGLVEEAQELAETVIEKDLLHYQSRYELALINKQLNRNKQSNAALNELENIMQDRVQSYLEFATDYANAGFYDEAVEILSRLESKGEQFPMVYYYLGYYWSLLNEPQKAANYFAEASQKPHTYCFPFRDESLEALNEALRYNPDDAMVYYYLGTMLYELQPGKAAELWEKSRSLDDGFYITHRNLAWAAREGNDLNKAVEYYREAFAGNREDIRLMYEVDNVYEQAGISPQVRYESIYEGNRNISSQQSSTYLRELGLLNFLGEYDEVIHIISSEDFVEAEGSQVLRDIFHNAHIFRSMQSASAGNYEAAITDMEAALDFPIGRWGSERRAQMNYLLGTYLEQIGNTDRARECFERAADELADGTEFLYDKGLAYRKLGMPEKAREQFNVLLNIANQRGDADAFRSFEAGTAGAIHEARNAYLRALAYKGLGRSGEARTQFARALGLNPAHLHARVMLENGY